LRLRDNILYSEARDKPVIPLYVFDSKDFAARRSFGDASHSVAHMGPFAARFLLESLGALRKSLQALGADLFVRVGEPRQVIPAFLSELRAAGLQGPIEVVWHDEAGACEAAEAAAVRAAVQGATPTPGQGGTSCVACASFWGATLWHPIDLAIYKQPTPSRQGGQEVDLSPKSWALIKQHGVQSYRRKAKASPIRPPWPAPSALRRPALTGIPVGDLPAFTDLFSPVAIFGFTVDEVRDILAAAMGDFDPRSAHPLRGGEDEGLAHLATFVSGPAAACDRTGGGDAGGGLESSAKVSAYLAFGCLSPRTIHAFVCAERRDGKADWLPENLEMRDFWIFYSLAHGRQLFVRDGDGPANLPATHWRKHDPTIWRRWLLGNTGLPLLDATMKELRATGYTSNRCRQIPVSVLANDLQLDWRSGAELYQWLLVDHDVGSNWGNWRYFAGVGCDPKRRHYKALSQGLRYDPEASFVKAWLPQLQVLSAREAHLIPIHRRRSVLADEVEWPEAVVDALKQLSWEDQKSLGRHASSLEAQEATAAPASGNGRGKGKGKDKDDKGKGKGNNRDIAERRDKGRAKGHQQLSSPQAIGEPQAASSGLPGNSKARRWHAKAAPHPAGAIGA
jgi:deoxyribodipyrimidine photo-lyase